MRPILGEKSGSRRWRTIFALGYSPERERSWEYGFRNLDHSKTRRADSEDERAMFKGPFYDKDRRNC